MPITSNPALVNLLFKNLEISNLEMVEKLCMKGVDLDSQNEDGSTPLCFASSTNNLEMTRLLIKFGASVDLTDKNHNTPLGIASKNGFLEIAKLLINKKTDINLRDANNSSPLWLASSCGHLHIVGLLTDNKADIDSQSEGGSTPLFMASRNGYTEIVKLLIEKKADLNIEDEGINALWIASQEGHTEIAKLLIKNKASLFSTDPYVKTPLRIASQNQHLEIVESLINALALQKSPAELAEMLSKDEYEFQYTDLVNSQTFLHCFSVIEDASHHKILDLIIKKIHLGAETDPTLNLDPKAEIYYTAFSSEEMEEMAKYKDVTPLFLAVQNQNLKAVKLLLDPKNTLQADVNASAKKLNVRGETLIENYSILELALDQIISDPKNIAKILPILKIIINEAEFPKFKEFQEKIVKNLKKYPKEVVELLNEKYPNEILALSQPGISSPIASAVSLSVSSERQ